MKSIFDRVLEEMRTERRRPLKPVATKTGYYVSQAVLDGSRRLLRDALRRSKQ